MRLLRYSLFTAIFCLGSALWGQATFAISSNVNSYKSTGGQITLTLSISYAGTPGALGFRVVPPASWTYASVGGTDVPTTLCSVGSKHNGTDGFEFYYATPPTGGASCTVTLNYPSDQTGNVSIGSQVLYYGTTGAEVTVSPSVALPALYLQQVPTISVQPASSTLVVGSAMNLSVTATGVGTLSYQWKKDGTAISGATSSTYSIATTVAGDSGSFTVEVSNAYGKTVSDAAEVVVTSKPQITSQTASTTVLFGGSTTLWVKAIGTAPLSYQWRLNGSPISGATSSTYTVSNASTKNSGNYTVVVSNSAAPSGVISSISVVQVIPVGVTATHAAVAVAARGYTPGSTVTVSNTITFSSKTTGLAWQVLLPSGFSYVSDTAAALTSPTVGATSTLEWSWETLPTSPYTFTYTLNVGGGTTGAQNINATVLARQSGENLPKIATPTPLQFLAAGLPHNVDSNGDWAVDSSELSALIALYNTVNGTTRTGCYSVNTGTTPYTWTSDSTRLASASVSLAAYHTADTDLDGKISLTELMRVIELFKTTNGTVRTGNYHIETGTEDGYATGP